MKREILFRGKREDTGEWVEGSLVILKNNYFIINSKIAIISDNYKGCSTIDERNGYFVDIGFCCKVVSETVGQYTGLTDRNGVKIFEGDIVKCVYSDCVGIVKFGEYGIGAYGFYIDWQNDRYHLLREDLIFWVNDGAIVAGNIYDDPVLLELAK